MICLLVTQFQYFHETSFIFKKTQVQYEGFHSLVLIKRIQTYIVGTVVLYISKLLGNI